MQRYRQDYCETGSGQQQLHGSSAQPYGVQGGHGQHYGVQGGHGQPYATQGHGKPFGGSGYVQSSGTTAVFGQDVFGDIMPSSFPPGTDPNVIELYNQIDRDNNGLIDDKELQSVLSNCSHNFSLRTVHLLMYQFTHSNKRVIGPQEFVPLLKSLRTWKTMFQRYDRDRNGSIDSSELGHALSSLGFRVSPVVVNLLVSKFSSSAGRCVLRYDSFIECCLTVKGLSETFNAKADCGKATFYYEEFLLNVLPFVIA